MIAPDLIGWAAAALMVATFACRNVRVMRPLAIATNLAFISYGALAELPPVLALHLLLLPVNLWRWAELAGRPPLLAQARAWLAWIAAALSMAQVERSTGITLVRGTTLCALVLLLSA